MEEKKNAVYFPFHGRELSDEAGVRSSSSSSSGARCKQLEKATYQSLHIRIMSGRGKGKASGTKSVSRSSKAGLQVKASKNPIEASLPCR